MHARMAKYSTLQAPDWAAPGVLEPMLNGVCRNCDVVESNLSVQEAAMWFANN